MTPSNNLEWAKHLLDEWKHRHEMFWKALYVSVGATVSIAIVPLTLTAFKDARQHLLFRVVHVTFAWAVFVGTTVFLVHEYCLLKSVQQEIKTLRGTYDPRPLGIREAYGTSARVGTLLYLAGFVAFLSLWTFWYSHTSTAAR
jgi:hypothetical protein